MATADIIQRKDVLGGKPVIKGTRISVDIIGSYIANNMSVSDIKFAYPHLTDQQIHAALHYLENRARLEGQKIGRAASQV